MGQIINLLIDLVKDMFDILENIEFLGTNLLKFNLTILLLSVVIPVLFTLVKNTRIVGSTPDAYQARHGERNHEPVEGRRMDRYK